MQIHKLGFTLLEILTTFAIIALLSAISYPIYTHHIIKAKRHKAEVALLHLANRLEQYHSLEGTYEKANLKVLHMANFIKDNSYELKINFVNDAHYKISAIPKYAQAKKDKRCGVLSVNDKGKKFNSGTASTHECWVT